MTDYTVNTDFSPKDALPVGDPDKLILGADLDAEFDEIAVAIATKYDSADIATQAQAEAGTSNAVLMTPLRVQQWADDGGGLVGDIQALTDPGADRILFWDDSAGAVAFLTVGTGLAISATTIASDDANIDHDALSNFVAGEHVDHGSVTLSAGEGLTGGGSISTSRSFALDINGLGLQENLTIANDTIAYYDASTGFQRKVTMAALQTALGGAVGDGRIYRSTNQALSGSTATTVVFNASDYDSLVTGSFSLSTGQYTAGSAATRVLATVGVQATSMPVDSSLIISVQVNGTTAATADIYMPSGTGAEDREQCLTVPLSLSATDVVRVRVTASTGMNIGGSVETFFGIVELA